MSVKKADRHLIKEKRNETRIKTLPKYKKNYSHVPITILMI